MNTFSWREQTISAEELFAQSSLPEVIKIEDTGGVDFGRHVDIGQPMFLYSQRRRTKVAAECFWWDTSRAGFSREGPLLEIPKDYPGWFELMPKEGKKVGHYGTISGVAVSGTHQFLFRTPAVGVRITDEQSGHKILGEIKIKPGEILTVDSVIRKKWQTTEETSASATQEPITKYLRCFTSAGEAICLPFAHPGRFSIVAREGSKNFNAVYRIDQLVQEFKFPLTVRLVFGRPPNTACSFSGILRLLEVYRSETLVALSLSPNKFMLLEIPADADIKLLLPKGDPKKSNSEIIKQAKGIGCQRVYSYLTGMKVIENTYASTDTAASHTKVAMAMEVGPEANQTEASLNEDEMAFHNDIWAYETESEHLYDTISEIIRDERLSFRSERGTDRVDEDGYLRPWDGHRRRTEAMKSDSMLSASGYENFPVKKDSRGRSDSVSTEGSRIELDVFKEEQDLTHEYIETSIGSIVLHESANFGTNQRITLQTQHRERSNLSSHHARQVSQSPSSHTTDSGAFSQTSDEKNFICHAPTDTWTPPADLTSLSVRDVTRCLRYIGVRERSVLRFADELVDGDMLVNMSDTSLKDGFSDLNGFDRQKIMRFIGGWRPKKL